MGYSLGLFHHHGGSACYNLFLGLGVLRLEDLIVHSLVFIGEVALLFDQLFDIDDVLVEEHFSDLAGVLLT